MERDGKQPPPRSGMAAFVFPPVGSSKHAGDRFCAIDRQAARASNIFTKCSHEQEQNIHILKRWFVRDLHIARQAAEKTGEIFSLNPDFCKQPFDAQINP